MGRKGQTLAELEQEAAVRLTQGSEASEGEDAGAAPWVSRVLRWVEEMRGGEVPKRHSPGTTDVMYWLLRAEKQPSIAGYAAAKMLDGFLLLPFDHAWVAARLLGEIREQAECARKDHREPTTWAEGKGGRPSDEGVVFRACAVMFLWELDGRKGGGASEAG